MGIVLPFSGLSIITWMSKYAISKRTTFLYRSVCETFSIGMQPDQYYISMVCLQIITTDWLTFNLILEFDDCRNFINEGISV